MVELTLSVERELPANTRSLPTPELCLAVHRTIAERSTTPNDPIRLAHWMTNVTVVDETSAGSSA